MARLKNLILRQGGVFLTLFLALSLSPVGLAVAAGTIGSLDIINGSVKSVDLGTGAVTNVKLAGNAVTSAKVANGAIGAVDIADGAVNSAKLANGAVNSAKIANGSIVNADIAAGAAIAASKINRTGLNADLLDGVNSSAFVKNNAGTTQTLEGNLSAPDYSYSSTRTGSLTITPLGGNIIGDWAIINSAAIKAGGATPVEWYAPVNLPDGATITDLSHYAATNDPAQTVAELVHWVTPVASVTSLDHGLYANAEWGLDTTSTITPGEETFDSDGAYRVHVYMNGGNGNNLQSGYVRVNYAYRSPGD